MICSANRLTGFYMMGTLAVKGLMKNLLTPLAKIVLVPLVSTAAAAATDADIQKKIFGSGITTLIFSNEELDDIMKIDKSLEDAGLLTKGVSETVENEVKEQKGGFLGNLAATLGASLLENMLSVKGVVRGGDGVIRAVEGTVATSR